MSSPARVCPIARGARPRAWSARRRVQTAISAADRTCAWIPAKSRTTSPIDALRGAGTEVVTLQPERRGLHGGDAQRPRVMTPLNWLTLDCRGHDRVDAVGERLRIVDGRRLERRRLNRIVDDRASPRAGSVRSRPFGITWRVPITATGTIGRPASMASRKLPALNRATWPSGLRVPSAKMMSDSPSDTSARQRLRMPARSGCFRSTNRWPPALQVPAEHRKARQRCLRDDPQLVRQRREDHRRVVDALVIGHEDVGAARRDALEPLDRDATPVVFRISHDHARAQPCAK